MKNLLIIIVVLIFSSPGCVKELPDPPVKHDNSNSQVPDTSNNLPHATNPDDSLPVGARLEFSDFDGFVYHAVKIGTLFWSIENLKTTHYNDGTAIPNVKGNSEWINMTSGAYCHYDNAESNSDIYGLLYNYYAMTSGKLAPEGWHVATWDEWMLLWAEVSDYDNGIGAFVNQEDWNVPFCAKAFVDHTPIKCTNSTGFTALPNGYRNYQEALLYNDPDEFRCMGGQASWWACGPNTSVIYCDEVFHFFYNDVPGKFGAFGIRLVKNRNQ